MAVLRAGGAFVKISTVGAPPMGGACPGVTHAKTCIDNTLSQFYRMTQNMSITQKVIH